jgi:hypothetical protein
VDVEVVGEAVEVGPEVVGVGVALAVVVGPVEGGEVDHIGPGVVDVGADAESVPVGVRVGVVDVAAGVVDVPVGVGVAEVIHVGVDVGLAVVGVGVAVVDVGVVPGADVVAGAVGTGTAGPLGVVNFALTCRPDAP